MQYSNGVITVFNDGLYYVYAQMYYHYPSSTYRRACFRIRVNGAGRAVAYWYNYNYKDYHTHYMERIIQLNKGDKLSITFENNCHYYFYNERAFFGSFLVNRLKSRNAACFRDGNEILCIFSLIQCVFL